MKKLDKLLSVLYTYSVKSEDSHILSEFYIITQGSIFCITFFAQTFKLKSNQTFIYTTQVIHQKQVLNIKGHIWVKYIWKEISCVIEGN